MKPGLRNAARRTKKWKTLREAGVRFNPDGSVDVPLNGELAIPALNALLHMSPRMEKPCRKK